MSTPSKTPTSVPTSSSGAVSSSSDQEINCKDLIAEYKKFIGQINADALAVPISNIRDFLNKLIEFIRRKQPYKDFNFNIDYQLFDFFDRTTNNSYKDQIIQLLITQIHIIIGIICPNNTELIDLNSLLAKKIILINQLASTHNKDNETYKSLDTAKGASPASTASVSTKKSIETQEGGANLVNKFYTKLMYKAYKRLYFLQNIMD
jgi:hypothetical protein